MGANDCVACRYAGTKPTPGANVQVAFNPAVTMPGTPTIDGHRMGVRTLAVIAWERGVPAAHGPAFYPHLTREEVVVACWWMGLYGPRTWRRRWGAWALNAGWHLWSRCLTFPDPPRKGAE
jgi:uncharacterized protein (DUF433 family)